MGLLIAVEGIDGSGKTTLSKALAKQLDAVWLCFPERATFYGKIIDSWLKGDWQASYKSIPVAVRENAALNAAVFQALQTVNRLEVAGHLEHLQRDSRNDVVCDRYWMSGYAYGKADGLNPEMLVKLHARLPQPDLHVLVDVPGDVAAERVRTRGGAKADVYEARGAAYFDKVHDAYYELWEKRASVAPREWVRIENTGSIDEAVVKVLRAIVALRGGS